MMCHRDEQTAIDRGIDGAHFFGFSLAYYYAFGEHRPGHRTSGTSSPSAAPRSGSPARSSPPTTGRSGLGCCRRVWAACGGRWHSGPDHRADRALRAGRRRPGDLRRAGGANRHEHICESIELFGAEVMPRFAEGAEEREAPSASAWRRRSSALSLGASPRAPRIPATWSSPTASPARHRRSRAHRGDGRAAPGTAARELLDRAGESGFAALVRNRTDDQSVASSTGAPGCR